MNRRFGRVRGSPAIVAAVVGLLALLAFAVRQGTSHPDAAGPQPSPAATAPAPGQAAAPSTSRSGALPPGIIGAVDAPASEAVIGTVFAANGWALSPEGIAGVDVRLDGRTYAAQYGTARSDVAAVKPGYPDSAHAGFDFRRAFADVAPERHRVDIVANARDGASSTLARKSLVPPDALAMWRGRLDDRPALARKSFYFLMMTSGITSGGAQGAVAQYREFVSRTQRTGVSVPILYMRTTHGAGGDWTFDPDFDLRRRCRDRPVVDDNLTSVIKTAIAERMPVQFILNGGIWADASCEISEWDLTDHLEEDPGNCQWTQGDEVFPDNYLKGLPGSTESPDLARSLTYNVYAKTVREYKRRNLQAAARTIAAFARDHPDLFVGVVLDADTYMNPFFRTRQAFDYNPGTLRQFRDWLRGAGPYAGAKGVPDLSRHRRSKSLTLAEVNALARAHWKSWSEVQPPRDLPGFVRPVGPGEQPIWKDPWWNVWDTFRKHVVDLHYDDLSRWTNEAGIPRDVIYSAQGLIHNDLHLSAFAIRVESPSAEYDSAGVSIEGAIPSHGHLGAIVYGNTARNAIMLRNGRSLFATIGRMDERWAIVEYNNTDLAKPLEPADYAMAYRTFRDAFNYDAREVSAMAWNGSNGDYAGKPGYVPYTAWRNTPAEQAMLDFLVSHADVPLGARLWTFGAATYPSADGWSAERGTLTAGAGHVTLEAEHGVVTLLSPPDQVIRPARIERLVLRFARDARPSHVKVSAQVTTNDAWRTVGSAAGPGDVVLDWPAEWRNPRTIVERLKIEFAFAGDSEASVLSRVLLYPREAPATRASP